MADNAKKGKKKGKKGGDDEKKVLFGRPGNHLKMGIVGLPNVGKSSLFNALCKMQVDASNFPFCTIDPNVARVEVPDERWSWLCEHWQPASRVPAFLTITDIAGLVRGAHEGEGLGNAFLSHIRAVDGIYHVVRVFKDEEITHVDGDLDPVRDLETISQELLLKDLELVETTLQGMTGGASRKKSKEEEDQIATLEKALEALNNGQQIRFAEWNNKDIVYLNTLQLLTAKPVTVLVNMSERDYLRQKNKWLKKIFEWVNEHAPGEVIIPYSGEVETNLNIMSEEEKAAWCEENETVSCFERIVLQGYHSLNLIHYFTAGEDEVKCWTIRDGTKAPAAAGVIHTDFENKFICAEVMAFDDFKEHGSENACKEAGKYRQQGKNYVVPDGSIIFFKHN